MTHELTDLECRYGTGTVYFHIELRGPRWEGVVTDGPLKATLRKPNHLATCAAGTYALLVQTMREYARGLNQQ